MSKKNINKRKEEIRHIHRDVQDYHDSIDKEEAERLASGAGRRGRAKKHKPVPEWSPDAEMLAIVNKTIYHKHKYMKDFSTLSIFAMEDGTYNISLEINDRSKEAYINKFYGKK